MSESKFENCNGEWRVRWNGKMVPLLEASVVLGGEKLELLEPPQLAPEGKPELSPEEAKLERLARCFFDTDPDVARHARHRAEDREELVPARIEVLWGEDWNHRATLARKRAAAYAPVVAEWEKRAFPIKVAKWKGTLASSENVIAPEPKLVPEKIGWAADNAGEDLEVSRVEFRHNWRSGPCAVIEIARPIPEALNLLRGVMDGHAKLRVESVPAELAPWESHEYTSAEKYDPLPRAEPELTRSERAMLEEEAWETRARRTLEKGKGESLDAVGWELGKLFEPATEMLERRRNIAGSTHWYEDDADYRARLFAFLDGRRYGQR
jgi:hypothetical protein